MPVYAVAEGNSTYLLLCPMCTSRTVHWYKTDVLTTDALNVCTVYTSTVVKNSLYLQARAAREITSHLLICSTSSCAFIVYAITEDNRSVSNVV